MRRLGSVPYLRRYLVGQSLSILGDTSLWLAMAIWVRELTGSNADAGLTFFFMAAPTIAGPLWGAVVDRLRRRRVLIVVNAASAVMLLALLLVHDRSGVWVIWLVMVGYGISGSVLNAAQAGFLRTLVPEEHLGGAQGWLQTVRQGLRLFSPLIGAGLFSLAGGHVVALIDAGTFVVAAAFVASIPADEPVPVREKGVGLVSEVGEGLAHIRRTPALRQILAALFVVCAVVGFVETAFVAVVTTGLGRPATWLGPMEALLGVGALVGGPTVAPAMRRWGEGRVCAAGMVAFGVGTGLLVVASVPVDAAGTVVGGFGLPWVIAAANTLVQRRTPGDLQGRVSATVDVLTGTPQSLSIAVGAGLVALVGYRPLLGAVTVASAGAGAWLVTRREQRVSAAPAGAGEAGAGPARLDAVDPVDLEAGGLGAGGGVPA